MNGYINLPEEIHFCFSIERNAKKGILATPTAFLFETFLCLELVLIRSQHCSITVSYLAKKCEIMRRLFPWKKTNKYEILVFKMKESYSFIQMINIVGNMSQILYIYVYFSSDPLKRHHHMMGHHWWLCDGPSHFTWCLIEYSLIYEVIIIPTQYFSEKSIPYSMWLSYISLLMNTGYWIE